MPSTPLTCCSIGAATVSATTWALAPGYVADTSTVGGAISGYCAIGSVNRATLPPSTMTMDSTEAKIGRLMKNRENILVNTSFPGSAREPGCVTSPSHTPHRRPAAWQRRWLCLDSRHWADRRDHGHGPPAL